MPRKRKAKPLGDIYMRWSPEEPVYGGLGEKAPAGVETCGPTLPKATVQLCMKRKGEPGQVLANATDVCAFAKGMEDADRENFVALHLNVRHRIIGVDHVAQGSLTGVEVHPREVFKAALLNNAAAVIFLHNHPSGDVQPSSADHELTERLRKAGELLGINVLDHIIRAGNACKSFADMGWLGTSADYTKFAKKV